MNYATFATVAEAIFLLHTRLSRFAPDGDVKTLGTEAGLREWLCSLVIAADEHDAEFGPPAETAIARSSGRWPPS